MNISTTQELEQALQDLQQKKVTQEQEFKVKIAEAKEWIQPKNILKRTVSNAVHNGSKTGLVLKAGAGIGSVFLATKLFGKKIKGIGSFLLKKTIGKILPF